MNEAPEFFAKDRKAWRTWLHNNHETHSAVWLVFNKGKQRTISYDAMVEEALCYGWIDSRPGKVSDTQSKLYFSKRKPKSVWSIINKQRIEHLIASKQMHEAGYEAIRIAQKNGAWDTLNASDALQEPEELSRQFNKNPTAQKNWLNFTPSTRRQILEWIYSAKREETRLHRIHTTVELAQQNKRANQHKM